MAESVKEKLLEDRIRDLEAFINNNKQNIEQKCLPKTKTKWWAQISPKARQSVVLFCILVLAYIVIFGLLILIQKMGTITFTSTIDGDVLKLVTSLPLTAFYILVFIGATAGYANSTKILKHTPFYKAMDAELQNRTLCDPGTGIKSKVRKTIELKKSDTFKDALEDFSIGKLPIVPIVEKNKAEGVVTYVDILNQMNEILEKYPDKTDNAKIGEELKSIKVQDMIPGLETHKSQFIIIKETDTLKKVLDTMLENRYHLLMVNDSDEEYRGMISLMDVMDDLIKPGSDDDKDI